MRIYPSRACRSTGIGGTARSNSTASANSPPRIPSAGRTRRFVTAARTRRRNVDPSDAGRDLGDYGIVHRVTFTLVNPTDAAVPVYLYEKPLGGPVRSTFFVDGQMKEVGCARLAQPYWFMTYQLAPHSSSASTTLTMTDGGSYYPIEFGVSATPPVAYTPPVGSADGCSPLPTPSPSPVPTQPPTPEPPSPPASPAATATPGG